MKKIKAIISGGGTGGHIYPAIAIANKLRERVPGAEILFVGAEGKLEMQKVPEAGYKIVGLPIRGIQRKLTWSNLSFPFRLLKSLLLARKVVKDFKPDVAVGVGGYASGPLLHQASKSGVPALIQEQNAFAGLTNKLLANKVAKVCVASLGMEKFFPAERIVLTGNPVRQDILDVDGKREEARKHFGLEKDSKTLLVLGGSLGALAINNAMLKHIKALDEQGISVIWPTGKLYFERVKRTTADMGLKNTLIVEYMKEMDLAYAASDVVLSRAGALSVSELCLVAKPTIFVPSPNVAEDHQTKNALALVKEDAGLMLRDSELSEKLLETVTGLFADEAKRKELSANMKKLAKPNAADEIVDEILKLVQ
ncbi:UDP-N-acetylglucosamine--N-acetylmuramyl-(pentapeptide) pyrophosphoryl-undecaprenol N-acetylglucosamine transferase [Fulvitalea axinellae]|uniref:UDP-N-acetylglucosamine--N-acetylmuramyl-(pentapeptide) pyrophosphoryl-undecaprenol N-acetylglucosamine transferase n=1 Tax=Fulvitalea axinellae TaxID=1182444 RepID=A0AAU9CC85_9BACT|nr:UDP-N-acetylglucosamine--N-acetylmuramyl-(pentapeptide) pyrophosphoryl-undecaprenol N-acetylglucosamine transferase [Fulvitalea axinellae]